MQEVFVVIQLMSSPEMKGLNLYLSTVLRSCVLQESCLKQDTGVLSIDYEKKIAIFHKTVCI